MDVRAVPVAQFTKDAVMTCTIPGSRSRLLRATVAVAFVAAGALAPCAGADDAKKVKGPSLTLKSSPPVSFSPARITVSAELKGGDESDAELYCPSLVWDWGDGTTSEANEDCEPFEAGKSTIKRRYISTHTYTTAGSFIVALRLKRGSKQIVGGTTSVQVKPGVRDIGDFPQP